VVQRRFPLTFSGFTVSQRGRDVAVAARDGNREIALATLIFKSAKLQEARGQIELPAAWRRPWGTDRTCNRRPNHPTHLRNRLA